LTAVITGSAGFIGRHLARKLEAEGEEVIGIDRAQGGQFDLNAFDIVESLEQLVSESDGVYHLAGTADPRAHANPEVMAADLEATIRLLQVCDQQHKPLVVASSAYALTRNTHYGITKYAIERIAGLHPGHVSVARLFNVYGPGQERAITYNSSVVTNLGRNILAGRYTVYSQQARDFVYIDDVVDTLIEIMELTRRHITGTYEIGSGTLTTILELGQAIADCLGRTEPVTLVPRLVTTQAPYHRPARTAHQPQTSLREGLKQTLESLLQ
jgi:nucleoside-diphosphate-sugar epimerase